MIVKGAFTIAMLFLLQDIAYCFSFFDGCHFLTHNDINVTFWHKCHNRVLRVVVFRLLCEENKVAYHQEDDHVVFGGQLRSLEIVISCISLGKGVSRKDVMAQSVDEKEIISFKIPNSKKWNHEDAKGTKVFLGNIEVIKVVFIKQMFLDIQNVVKYK